MLLSFGKKIKKKITNIQESKEMLTSRAGLGIFSEYLNKQDWLVEMLDCCRDFKSSRKGLHPGEQIRQILLNFVDGTSTHLNVFDEKIKDPSYGLLIGAEGPLSTSSVKRLLGRIRPRTLQRIADRFFIKRLKLERAPYIKLDIDTVVFDNDSAQVREGCSVTYKKVKGFQPLMIKWNGYVVCWKFREGKAHSNHGDDALKIISRAVSLVRKAVDKPIVLTADSGFFDQKIMQLCEEMKVAYIIGGKQFTDIRERVQSIPEDEFGVFSSGKDASHEWYYTEFGDKRGSWDKERRLVVTQLCCVDGQMLIPGLGKMTMSYTNLGTDLELMRSFEDAGVAYLAETEKIIMLMHNRGDDELTHRHVKDFATREQLPCKEFEMNRSYFEIMLLAFNFYESFKRDCLDTIIPATSYPEKFRRKFLDIAGRIIFKSRRIILSIPEVIVEQLSLKEVWQRASAPI